MVFSHSENSNLDPLSYVNLRGPHTDNQLASFAAMNSRDAPSNSHATDVGKVNIFTSQESKIASTSLKDGSPISPENFSFSCLPGSSCHISSLDHAKRPLSDVRPFQAACKRPKQTDENTWLYSNGEGPFTGAFETSVSALADGFAETREPDHICLNSGISDCSTSSGIPYANLEQLIGEESLYLPDWVTSFPGYFEDFQPATGSDLVDAIDSPIHEYLPRKGVPVGPDHQADIPEWRPRVSMTMPGGSGSCVDLANSSVSTSGSATRDEDSESDKWIQHCIIPNPSSYHVGDDRVLDCECSDEGSIRCVRQHVMESREKLKKCFGEDKFHDLGLREMGEDIAQGWTDEEEHIFQRVVFSNPPSLGKNFWHFLPLALPGKTKMELVSYYFNVFMLRKRAQQNRSDLLHVDSDDDESPDSPDEPAVTEDEDSAVESPTHGYYMKNTMSTEFEDSFPR